MKKARASLVALAVVKVDVAGEPHFLMRRNQKWGDLSFPGGHLNERDRGDFRRTALRELLEEASFLRLLRDKIELSKLTDVIHYGPTFSPSANRVVEYDAQFFLTTFKADPGPAFLSLSPRSPNMLVSERALLQRELPAAQWVAILDGAIPGGLGQIPPSWIRPLMIGAKSKYETVEQLEMHLRH